MFSHNKRDNLPIVNYCSFILTGIFSILYSIGRTWQGNTTVNVLPLFTVEVTSIVPFI